LGTYDADIDSLLIFSQYLTCLVTKNLASQKKAEAYQVVVDQGEVRAGDNQGLRLQGLGLGVLEWERSFGGCFSQEAPVVPPSPSPPR